MLISLTLTLFIILGIFAIISIINKMDVIKSVYINRIKESKKLIINNHQKKNMGSISAEKVAISDLEATLDKILEKKAQDNKIKSEYIINEYLTVVLEDGQTSIYVKGEYFRQCKYLLLNIPINRISDFDDIDSIDEASERLDRSLEYNELNDIIIPPEVEFWGHCSNLQVWAENNYDSRLLHSNLSFPLLKQLKEVGDPMAKRVFKEEVAIRFESGYEPVKTFLLKSGYLNDFTEDELYAIGGKELVSKILKEDNQELAPQNYYLVNYYRIRKTQKKLYKYELKYQILNSKFERLKKKWKSTRNPSILLYNKIIKKYLKKRNKIKNTVERIIYQLRSYNVKIEIKDYPIVNELSMDL